MNDETKRDETKPDEIDDAPKVPDILDRASCKANSRRFVKRSVAAETVWCLRHEAEGVAYCLSNESGEGRSRNHDPSPKSAGEEIAVLMFFSDRAYATHVKEESFPEYDESEITLFDFLYRWLPGMENDGVLAGTNWTGRLVGLEVDAVKLREELYEEMSEELLGSYEAEYDRLASEGDAK